MEYQIKSTSSFHNNNNNNNNNNVIINNPCNNNWWKTMMSDEEVQMMNNGGLRKGTWTDQEDNKLTSVIALHGAARWSTLATLAGLKRSGKSCRLRWLNYLRPGLRRGTFTPNEQLLILELHFRWGNRWSKIAESLPGRTDNEIKNYWRTKVQKLAKQFHYNVNSPEFRECLRQIWIPRLIDQIHAVASTPSSKAQSDAQDNQPRLGLMGSSSSSSISSETCCLFDTHTSWAQNSLPQHVVEPIIVTDSCAAQISPQSGSSAELDTNSEHIDNYLRDMTLNNEEDDMLFLQQLGYLIF